MSTGPPGYVHPKTALLGMALGVEAYSRDPPRVSVPAPLWTVPHSPPTVRSSDAERSYPRATYVDPAGGFAQCRPDHAESTSAGMADPFIQQPSRRTEVHSAGTQLYAVAAGFIGHPRHDARSRPFANTLVSLPAYTPDGLSTPNTSGDVSKHAGHTSGMRLTTQTDMKTTPTFDFQTWEDRVSTGFMSQTSPVRLYPSQLHARTPHSAHRIQPHPVRNETLHAGSVNPPSTYSEEDFYAFLCEWTDERGHVCNMQIAGDRVSMSHHLSRHHDVTGDEKSQRPCLWQGCTETMNKGSLARHVVSRHLRAGASCGFCSKVYSRADVARRHTKKCKAANATSGDKDDVKG